MNLLINEMFGNIDDMDATELSAAAVLPVSSVSRVLVITIYATVNPSVNIPPIATVMSRLRMKPNTRKNMTMRSSATEIPVTGIRMLDSIVPMMNVIPAPARMPNPRHMEFMITKLIVTGSIEAVASFAITICVADKGIGSKVSRSSAV